VFLDATDLAYMQISTGTLDYNTAIREAVKEAARKGLQVIYFESGHRDKIDVATRRAVLTGVNQTAGELTEARADELETDLVQTSAHIGARNKGDVPENHEMWQGKVFTRGKAPNNTQYPNFYDVTGYMTVTGLYGVNCRHSHYPYFKGISENAYKQAVLDDYASKTATYNGKEMSWYDATQVQRKIERDIRKAKREQAMVEAAGLDASEEKQRVRNLQAQMRDFVEQTGLQRQYPREQAVFTPTLMNISEAGKKIDFTSGDYQHVADLGNIQSFYQANDPGKPYVTQSPVIYNQYAVRHLADETHSKRLDWLKENQEGLMQAIVNPDFIEKVIRKRVDGHYSITLISELFLGNKSEQRFLVAAVSLGLKPGKSYHQITTIHPARWKDLFYQNGELKKKYLRIK